MLTNCSQLQLPSGGAGTSATTADDTYAVFAVNSHDTDPNAGEVNIFNATSMKWFKTKLSGGRTNIAAANWKHMAIFAGGTVERGQPKSKSIDVWNSQTNTWSLEQMSIGRDLLGVGSNGDFTIFAGGSAPQVNQSETAVVDIWNHKTNKWTVSKLSQPRKKPHAIAAGNKIIVAGGELAKPSGLQVGGYSSTVDIFDITTETWTVATLSQPRQYFGMSVPSAAASRVLICDACVCLSSHAFTGAASATPTMAVFGGGFANYDASRLGAGYRSNVVDIYDATTSKWTTSKLSYNRSNLDAATIANRYVAFGSGNIDNVSKITFDFFDGTTGEWAASHGHAPGNPSVTGVGSAAFFANGDGTVDVIAVNGPCPK
jgi:hypothetical protein